MIMHGWHLLLVIVAKLLSNSQAKIPVRLASKVMASGTSAASGLSNHSNADLGGSKYSPQNERRGKKSFLRTPKSWACLMGKKTESIDRDGGDEESETQTTPYSERLDASDSNGDNDKKSEVEKEEARGTSSPDSLNADTAEIEKNNMSQTQLADEDDEIETDSHHSETQPANQTRSGILHFAHPPGLMFPCSRPEPYIVPDKQTYPPRNSSPSLLSTILSLFLPRPVPPAPYGPPMIPSSPGHINGNIPILSLVLRFGLISLGTIFFELFGHGSRSDAFLPTPAQHYTFERLNDRYRRDASALRMALDSPPPGIGRKKWKRVFHMKRREVASVLMPSENLSAANGTQTTVAEPPSLSNGALYNRTVVILEMKPDSRVGHGMAEQLRDTVSFLIELHRDHEDRRHDDLANSVSSKILSSKLLSRYLFTRPFTHHRNSKGTRTSLGTELEVVLFLDSPGGTVQDYGLASSHLSRLRKEPHVTLSVCVDRIAASGGYMMACQATPGHLFAAPFAMLGSIGVLMETVNVNEVLKRYGVRPLIIKAGKNKAPLKTLGEVTQEELKMAQNEANVIHESFQQWVMQSRPNVVISQDWIEKVCTGSVFLGKEAQELGLVDRVLTSDEYVAERIMAGDRVLKLIPYKGPQFVLMKSSPLDLLFSGLDMDVGAKIRERIKVLVIGLLQCITPLFRVGAAVSILNHLALVLSHYPDYRWPA